MTPGLPKKRVRAKRPGRCAKGGTGQANARAPSGRGEKLGGEGRGGGGASERRARAERAGRCVRSGAARAGANKKSDGGGGGGGRGRGRAGAAKGELSPALPEQRLRAKRPDRFAKSGAGQKTPGRLRGGRAGSRGKRRASRN